MYVFPYFSISSFFPTLGLRDVIRDDQFELHHQQQEEQLEEVEKGTDRLMIFMFTWLGLITIVTIVVFVVIYKRLGRHDDDDEESHGAEDDVTSGSNEKKALPLPEKSSVVDFRVYDPRYTIPSVDTTATPPPPPPQVVVNVLAAPTKVHNNTTTKGSDSKGQNKKNAANVEAGQ